MKTTMYLRVESFPSDGRLLRLSKMENSPLPVTSGVMEFCFMRFGHWRPNPMEILPMNRYHHSFC